MQKVKDEIQLLYRYGMDAAGYSKADVESMLKTIDFAALTQALRHNSETVYSIFVDGDFPNMLRHRGRESGPPGFTSITSFPTRNFWRKE